MARFSGVGWGGFELPPPTYEDVIKAINNMPPRFKGEKKVLFLSRNNSL